MNQRDACSRPDCILRKRAFSSVCMKHQTKASKIVDFAMLALCGSVWVYAVIGVPVFAVLFFIAMMGR